MDGSKGISGGITRVDDERSLPTEGIPNSRTELYKNGYKVQSRWYDLNGNVVKNRDYMHSGKMQFPHDHKWNFGTREKNI